MKIKLLQEMITADGNVFKPGEYDVCNTWLNHTLDCIYIEIQAENTKRCICELDDKFEMSKHSTRGYSNDKRI